MVKRCRTIATAKVPKLRFCKNCLARAEESGTKDDMLQKAREGSWICPNAKPDCGKKIE